jgi:hypothetical protein
MTEAHVGARGPRGPHRAARSRRLEQVACRCTLTSGVFSLSHRTVL